MPSARRWSPPRWAIRARMPATCSMPSFVASACRAACARSRSAPNISTASRNRRWRRHGCRATRAGSRDRRRCAKFLIWLHERILNSMYTGKHAHLRPLQPAFIMASTGEAVTYRELDARSNRLAHLFRNRGLKRLDHYSIFMENNNRYLEACSAGERSGLYYTCVNSYLTSSELAYILTNSRSRILITSKAKLDIAREALKECPKVELCIVADGAGETWPESDRIVGLQQATTGLPNTPIPDECVG